MTSDVVLVLTTVPSGDGEAIARAIVDERLAACVNLFPPMESFYRWEGRIAQDAERQLIIKTTDDMVERLRDRITALHPYELPEFIVLTVAGGSPAYLDWVRTSADGADGRGRAG